MYSSNSIVNDFKGAFNKPNNSHVQLIIINVVVFVVVGLLRVITNLGGVESVYQIVSDQFWIPAYLPEFMTKPWTIFSYMFMHAGIGHIFWNMLIFYFFGRLIIEYIGNEKLISIFIVGGLAGALAFLFMYNVIPFYSDRVLGSQMVGASGGINAVIVAAATLLPNYTFHLIFIGPVRIKYIALFVVLSSLLYSTDGNAGGNIAHLGGAAIGFLYIRSIQSGTDIGRWVIVVMNFFKSFFVRQPNMKVNYSRKTKKSPKTATAKTTGTNINEQQEIDAILDKISQSGYESLSKEEKQKLFNASKK